MLIAQITDMHLGFDPDNPAEFNRKRLDKVLQTLNELDRKPDLLFATGDLVEYGDVDSYRRLERAFGACDFPIHLALGNHDIRTNFSGVFPSVPVIAGGFVQYAFDAGPLRFVIIDTLEEGRHGGGFCETRATWLRAALAAAPDRPTVVVLHHPPIETGIAWMTTEPEEEWVIRLDRAMRGHGQVIGMICGHIHRPIVAGWKGRPLTVCPSTAPQVALTLAPLDPDVPDGRPMIIADAPGYALHYWNGEGLITHFDTADEHVALARFDRSMQSLVHLLVGERPSCQAAQATGAAAVNE